MRSFLPPLLAASMQLSHAFLPPLVAAPTRRGAAPPCMVSAADIGSLQVSDGYHRRRGVADGPSGRFRWLQTTDDLEFEVPLPPGARARDISCEVRRGRIDARLAGRDAPLLSGAFAGEVLASEAEWLIDEDTSAGAPAGARVLHVLVPKVKPFLTQEEKRFRGAPVRVTQTDPMWPEIFDRGDGGAPRTGAGEAVADGDFGSAEGIASMVNLAARVDPADAGTSFDPSRAWFGPADDPPTP